MPRGDLPVREPPLPRVALLNVRDNENTATANKDVELKTPSNASKQKQGVPGRQVRDTVEAPYNTSHPSPFTAKRGEVDQVSCKRSDARSIKAEQMRTKLKSAARLTPQGPSRASVAANVVGGVHRGATDFFSGKNKEPTTPISETPPHIHMVSPPREAEGKFESMMRVARQRFPEKEAQKEGRNPPEMPPALEFEELSVSPQGSDKGSITEMGGKVTSRSHPRSYKQESEKYNRMLIEARCQLNEGGRGGRGVETSTAFIENKETMQEKESEEKPVNGVNPLKAPAKARTLTMGPLASAAACKSGTSAMQALDALRLDALDALRETRGEETELSRKA